MDQRDFSIPYLIAFAVFFMSFGIWLTQEHLSAWGIMDQSLQSANPLTRATALLEIRIAKIMLLVMGGVCLLAALAYLRLRQMDAYQRFIHQTPPALASYRAHLSEVGSVSFRIMMPALMLGAAYLAFGNDIFAKPTLALINLEDGLLETTSAIILLLASICAACVAARLVGAGLKAHLFMHAFLALLFFAMAGEEISWGQRYLGFETPENLQGLNVQNEVNLHNMFGYLFDHLFILLFFVWGCVVPLLYAVSRFFRRLFDLIGLPIPGAGLSIAMLIITLTQEQITDPLLGEVYVLRVPELREFFSAIAFLMLMLESYRYLVPQEDLRRRSDPSHAGPIGGIVTTKTKMR